jgi:hypothetical protein
VSSSNPNHYAGAEWVQANRYVLRGRTMSPLGVRVADLLGYLFYGIYHLDGGALSKVEWDNERYMSINLRCGDMATFDNDDLTRLVFLAHQFCLRCSVEAATIGMLRLRFHPRKREGGTGTRHPTLAQAVASFPLEAMAPIEARTSIEPDATGIVDASGAMEVVV